MWFKVFKGHYGLLINTTVYIQKVLFPRRGSNSRPSHLSANTAYKYDALTDWATGEHIHTQSGKPNTGEQFA